jgi:polyribonucleotide nucleotidyltransferase
VLAINAASLSTQLSGLPFSGPVGGVRVALIDGQWVAFPTHSQLEDAVFDMVVAGRVTETGDVAIMMVEAEATEQTWTSSRAAPGADRGGRRRGLEAAKPFIKQLCEAQAELAKQAAKPVQEFPIFLDYEDDVYAAVEAAATARPRRRADHRRQAGARGRSSTRSRPRCSSSSAGQFEGREKEIGAAFRSLTKKLVRERVCATRSASTAAACRHPAPVGRGRRLPRCTARRCSSAARPRSWASPR